MLSVLNMAKGVRAPTPAPVVSGQSAFFQNIINQGIAVPWFVILIFAGIIPFVPFSYLGYAGVNLMVTGSIGWGFVKAFVQVAVALIGKVSSQTFPDIWVLPYLFMYSPWYIYDIIQLFNPAFSKVDVKTGNVIGGNGFKIPFLQKKIGTADGKLTLPVGALIIIIICAGLNNFLDYLPDEIVASVKPIIKTILAVIGGGTAVAGGGVGAWTMGPSFLKGLSENMGGLSAAPVAPAAPVPAAPAIPAVLSAAPAIPAVLSAAPAIPAALSAAPAIPAALSAVTPAMAGGGVDLDAIAKNLMEDTSSGVGAYLLVGSLALVAVGGAAIAAVRT